MTTIVASDPAPLRILMFSSLFSSPAEPRTGMHVRDRVRATARFADVEVLAPVAWLPQRVGVRGRHYDAVPKVERVEGLPAHHPKYAVMPTVLGTVQPLTLALSSLPAALAIHRQFPFNMIHAASAWPDGVAAAALAAAMHIPLFITVEPRDIQAVNSRARRAMLKWAFGRTSTVFATSQEVHDQVIELGVPARRVEIGPVGVNVDWFRMLDREAARGCLGIPNGARVVLSVGRLSQSKHFPDLVDAFAQVAARDANLRLVLVADPDPKAATDEIGVAINRAGLRDRVSLARTHSPEQMVWWYNAADLLCIPATPASSGIVVFEAMACGLPCVTFSDPAPGAGASAIRFLAETIEETLQRPWNREEIARRAQARGWDVIAREYSERRVDGGGLYHALA